MEYKLTYFGVRGIAEPIRFLLKYGDIKFEDERLEKADWPQLKNKFNFGQVPALTVNGKVYNQSVAVARFFAKKVGLIGKDEFEDMEIDSAVDTIVDFRTKVIMVHFEADEAAKATKKEALLKETIPYYMSRFEKIAADNGDHLACKKLTWADLYFVALLETLNFVCGTDITADYPHLKSIEKKVLEIPAIKAWVETRPKSEL